MIFSVTLLQGSNSLVWTLVSFTGLPLAVSKVTKAKKALYNTSVSLYFRAVDFSGKSSP